MKRAFALIAAIFPLVVCPFLAGQNQNSRSSAETAPKVQFVEVEPNVKLEVLDWGGQGRSLMLLAGLGNTAHIFEKIAPKLASNFHVFGITRRGFGDSGVPEPNKTNYSAQRLGEDVLAIIRALKLEKPLVAGHSIAGEELSYIGTTHPEKVAGIVYLDAGYPYALYNKSRGDLTVDADELRRKLDELVNQLRGAGRKKLVDELLASDLPAMERDLQREQKEMATMLDLPSRPGYSHISSAVIQGEQRFGPVKCPLLAIFAYPQDFENGFPGLNPSQSAAVGAILNETSSTQVKLFEDTYPNSRVIVLPHATHHVFVSNEADVLREIDRFAETLR